MVPLRLPWHRVVVLERLSCVQRLAEALDRERATGEILRLPRPVLAHGELVAHGDKGIGGASGRRPSADKRDKDKNGAQDGRTNEGVHGLSAYNKIAHDFFANADIAQRDVNFSPFRPPGEDPRSADVSELEHRLEIPVEAARAPAYRISKLSPRSSPLASRHS